MASSMNLRVVAEGVETREQIQFLRARRCDEVQGYYLSRPLPADEVRTFLGQGAIFREEGASRREIVIVGSDPSTAAQMRTVLQNQGYVIRTAADECEAMEALASSEVEWVFTEQSRKPGSGIELLSHIRSEHPRTKTALLGAGADCTTLVAAINSGAIDKFLEKTDLATKLMDLLHEDSGTDIPSGSAANDQCSPLDGDARTSIARPVPETTTV
jgi:ActR/RegA family two-component response regulator